MHSRKGIKTDVLFYPVKLAMAVAVTILFLNIPCYGISGFSEGGINTIRDAPGQKIKEKGEGPGAADRQNVYFAEGKLTVNISDMPLSGIMEEIAKITGVHVSWQNEQSGNREKMLSVGFTGLSIDNAIKNILQGESYLLFYASGDASGHVSRVLILPGSEKGTEQRGRSHADAGTEQRFVPPPPPVQSPGEKYAMDMPDFEREILRPEFEVFYNLEESQIPEQFLNMPPMDMEQW